MSDSLRAGVGRLLRRRESSLVAILVAILLVVSIVQPRFLSGQNIRDGILIPVALVVLVAVGETVVVLTRNIDLSVASTVGLSAYLVAAFARANPGVPVALTLLIGLGVGLVLGSINAALVVVAQVPSIVATLGTLFVYRGVASFVSGAGTPVTANELTQEFIDFPSMPILGVPLVVIVALLVLVIASLVLRRTRAGRSVYAVGSNIDAARVSGIVVWRPVAGALLLSGGLSGFTGALWAMRYTGANSSSATGYELLVIASVVVGGVAIFGGRGTVVGAAIGAVLLITVQNSLNLLNISSYWLTAIYGLTIVVAVMADALIARGGRLAPLLAKGRS